MSDTHPDGLLQGGCHCGNIAFSLEWPTGEADIPARACSCSFCHMHGAAWTSHPRAKLTVRIGNDVPVSIYAFGTQTARFHVCAGCGAVPFASSEIGGIVLAVVNVNVLRDVDGTRLRRAPSDVDGEDVQTRLARRERNWIARVAIERP